MPHISKFVQNRLVIILDLTLNLNFGLFYKIRQVYNLCLSNRKNSYITPRTWSPHLAHTEVVYFWETPIFSIRNNDHVFEQKSFVSKEMSFYLI